MAPLPVIAGVARVSFNWNSAHGIAPVNVMHFDTVIGTETGIAAAIESCFDDAMWSYVQQDWSFTSMTVTKLDGSSAGVTVPCAAQGSLTAGDWIPGGAGVISFYTTQRGSRGRGRIYLGPLAETETGVGLIQTTVAVQAAWDTFVTDARAAGVAPVVASYVHADAHDIIAVQARSVMGQQRRRNDQLR